VIETPRPDDHPEHTEAEYPTTRSLIAQSADVCEDLIPPQALSLSPDCDDGQRLLPGYVSVAFDAMDHWLEEDEPGYYLPFVDVRRHLLRPSDTPSVCPYKGAAQHWHLSTATSTVDDAALEPAAPAAGGSVGRPACLLLPGQGRRRRRRRAGHGVTRVAAVGCPRPSVAPTPYQPGRDRLRGGAVELRYRTLV
jgi:hypothetical protein